MSYLIYRRFFNVKFFWSLRMCPSTHVFNSNFATGCRLLRYREPWFLWLLLTAYSGFHYNMSVLHGGLSPLVVCFPTHLIHRGHPSLVWTPDASHKQHSTNTCPSPILLVMGEQSLISNDKDPLYIDLYPVI